MTVDSRNSGPMVELIDEALAALVQAMDATSCAAQLAERLKSTLQTGAETPVERPLNRDELRAAHRRAHRPGSLGKVASDPELEAFILARMETMTLKETVAAVAAAFPPDRHVSVSAVNRWWLRTGKALLARRP